MTALVRRPVTYRLAILLLLYVAVDFAVPPAPTPPASWDGDESVEAVQVRRVGAPPRLHARGFVLERAPDGALTAPGVRPPLSGQIRPAWRRAVPRRPALRGPTSGPPSEDH